MRNEAVKDDICAWPEGKDFITSNTASGSSSAAPQSDRSISTLPPYIEQLIRSHLGWQVSIKWGLGTAVNVLSTIFKAMLKVRPTQNLRNIVEVLIVLDKNTGLKGMTPNRNNSVRKTMTSKGRITESRRTLVETVSPL